MRVHETGAQHCEMWRAARRVTLGTAVAGGAYVAVDQQRREHVVGTGEGFTRFARTMYFGCRAAWDYKFELGPVEDKFGKQSDEYRQLRKAVDKRNAERMLYVCKLHGESPAVGPDKRPALLTSDLAARPR